MRLFNSAVLMLAGGLICFQATADTVDSTAVTTFESGSVLSSQEMNATISALISAINDNAARIAELEANAPTTSVAGRSYCVKSAEFGLFQGTVDDGTGTGGTTTALTGVEQGSFVANITFVADGTGTLTGVEDDFVFGSVFDGLSQGTPELGAQSLTWTQTGNRLTLTIPEDGGIEVVNVGVVNSGEVLLSGGTESETDAFFSSLIVAVEVDPSETCDGIFSF